MAKTKVRVTDQGEVMIPVSLEPEVIGKVADAIKAATKGLGYEQSIPATWYVGIIAAQFIGLSKKDFIEQVLEWLWPLTESEMERFGKYISEMNEVHKRN